MSLVEVMLATVILVIAILPLVGIQMRTTQGISAGLDEIEATTIATATLEALQSAPFSTLSRIPEGVETSVEELSEELRGLLRLPASGDRFRLLLTVGTTRVTPVPTAGLPGDRAAYVEALGELRHVQVTCKFSGRASVGGAAVRRRQVVLGSLVSRAGRVR